MSAVSPSLTNIPTKNPMPASLSTAAVTAPITLTADQQHALDAFVYFLSDPIETVFVLQGYSGTGKTTLVKTLLERLDSFMNTVRLLVPNLPNYEVALTATTNKAAEAFSFLTNQEVSTIHSFLGLRVNLDYATGISTLLPTSNQKKEHYLLFIDEASYIDSMLLGRIFSMTDKCKIVFMGDPAQLTPVKASNTPVFDANFSGAALTQVVRQAADNPIVDLSTRFRETVKSGEFFSFKPDGHYIRHMDRTAFGQAIEAEFTRPGWRYQDSKILAWTNNCVINYNHAVRDMVKGNPDFQVGDYAVCNKYVSAKPYAIKTDQMVCITDISEEVILHGVAGFYYELDHVSRLFAPHSLVEKNEAIKNARNNSNYNALRDMDSWIDLRAAYACTINKSQGSTFDRVFIDLDDVRRCNSGEQIARMLYVAISRARYQVFLTGDII